MLYYVQEFKLANTNAITEVITLPPKARLTIQTALTATYMHKYIQRDASVSWILFQELYQELYIFRAFAMPIIRSNINA
jgi:hypothetical protein